MFADTIEQKLHDWVEEKLKGFKQYVDEALEKVEIRIERRFAAMLLNDAAAQEKALVAGGITAQSVPPPRSGADGK